jgi:single-strand DNA-binding protein
MASVNKVILMGNLGKDPEVRFMPNGDAVCNWKDKNGEKQERTEWHNIVMYRKLAEIAGEYLKKGRPVFIEGRLQTRKWQTKEGQDRYTTEIIAESMQMLGGRDSGSGSSSDSSKAQNQSASQGHDEFNQAPQRTSGATQAAATNFDDFEDDIPF